MKRSGLMALVVLVTACSGSTDPVTDDPLEAVLNAPQELTLGFGDEQSVGGSVLMVSFARVVEDSRCPAGVLCAWAGNAVVELGIRMGMGPTVPLQVNTTLEPRFQDWNGVRFSVLELLPQPRANDPPRQEGYSVKVRVQRTD